MRDLLYPVLLKNFELSEEKNGLYYPDQEEKTTFKRMKEVLQTEGMTFHPSKAFEIDYILVVGAKSVEICKRLYPSLFKTRSKSSVRISLSEM